ncbi:hypothetical protein GJAV_G00075980 [Gymnothorax javanicus]|nr:hypothetical protein GJAV_G00075980 [Gymnothorax javanicus]
MVLLAAADDGCAVLLWSRLLHSQTHVPLPTQRGARLQRVLHPPACLHTGVPAWDAELRRSRRPDDDDSPHPAYQVQPNSSHMMAPYPPPPSYCNHPPPPYDQLFNTSEKK